MSNHFRGRGNLAASPVLKHVEIDDEQRPVAEMRVYFDRPLPVDDGDFDDQGGFWLNVNLWGPRAEQAAKLLPKGARVFVEGTLVQDQWDDKDSGEPRTQIKLNARYIALDLSRVDAITLRPKAEGEAATDA